MTKITLHNTPKLSEHDADRKFNERRVSLVPIIKGYVSNHDLFKGKDVSITFSEKGVGSLVSIVEVEGKKMILKVPLSLTFSKGEALFLKAWEKTGVKVPRVYEEGMFKELSYVLMEYIDAPILGDAFSADELIKKEIYIELGKTLRTMHSPKAKGYGAVVDGNAEYSHFEDWLKGPDMQKRVDYVQEQKLLGDEHGSITEIYKILIDHVKAENKSSYCHDDFGTSNIFATEPITVFDPNPRFNNGYLDLGRSILMLAGHQKVIEIEQLIKGYFEAHPYNEKALQASVVLNAYMKLPYSHKKQRAEIISNIQNYLRQKRYLLEK